VLVRVALTTAGCPLRTQIKTDVESKVRGLPGVTDVQVEYGEMTAEQKTKAMERARWNARESAEPTEVPASARVLAVASGKGGVGKSTVAANLALALHMLGRRVGLLDADIYGPSIPLMMGLFGAKPTSEDGKSVNPLAAYGVKVDVATATILTSLPEGFEEL